MKSFISSKAFITLCGMIILITCLFTLVGFGIYALETGKSLEPVGLIITFFTSTCAGLIGYWWGTSASSHEKDSTINSMISNSIDTLTTTTTNRA